MVLYARRRHSPQLSPLMRLHLSSPVSERVQLAKLCNSCDWPKAIRLLDSLLAKSFAVQDIWFIFPSSPPSQKHEISQSSYVVSPQSSYMVSKIDSSVPYLIKGLS